MDSNSYAAWETKFQHILDVRDLSEQDKNDYTLYRISESQKYDMEIFRQECEERGFQKGLERSDTKAILSIHSLGYTPPQISDLLEIPIENVIEVLKNHGFKLTD